MIGVPLLSALIVVVVESASNRRVIEIVFLEESVERVSVDVLVDEPLEDILVVGLRNRRDDGRAQLFVRVRLVVEIRRVVHTCNSALDTKPVGTSICWRSDPSGGERCRLQWVSAERDSTEGYGRLRGRRRN
ncbi:hypothetical protein GCM10027355_30230 [Haloplanus salinarum]